MKRATHPRSSRRRACRRAFSGPHSERRKWSMSEADRWLEQARRHPCRRPSDRALSRRMRAPGDDRPGRDTPARSRSERPTGAPSSGSSPCPKTSPGRTRPGSSARSPAGELTMPERSACVEPNGRIRAPRPVARAGGRTIRADRPRRGQLLRAIRRHAVRNRRPRPPPVAQQPRYGRLSAFRPPMRDRRSCRGAPPGRAGCRGTATGGSRADGRRRRRAIDPAASRRARRQSG